MGAGVGTAPLPALEGAAARLGLMREDIPTLVAGHASARQIETANDSELSATGAVVVDAPAVTIAEGLGDLSLLARMGMTTSSKRLPDNVTVAEFDTLAIPPEDLTNLRGARPGRSAIKLSASELRGLVGIGGSETQVAFKRALLARVAGWRANGLSGLGTYADKHDPVDQAAVSKALLDSLVQMRPAGEFTLIDSYEYWSIERLGDLKPMVVLTHVSIYALGASRRVETVQLYASHYLEGLVTSIDLIPLADADKESTLVRLTFRAQVDALGGMFGALKRRVGRGRLVKELTDGLERLRATAVPVS